MMEPVNVFRKPENLHELYLDTAIEAIQSEYPDQHNRYLIHFRQSEVHDLGLLVDYYSMDGKMYGRVTDEMTGLDIHLFEGRVHDISAVVVEAELEDSVQSRLKTITQSRHLL